MANSTSGSITFQFNIRGAHDAESIKDNYGNWFKIYRGVSASVSDVKIDKVQTEPPKENTEIRRMNVYKKIMTDIIGSNYEISKRTSYASGITFCFRVGTRPQTVNGIKVHSKHVYIDFYDNGSVKFDHRIDQTKRICDLNDPEFHVKFRKFFEEVMFHA